MIKTECGIYGKNAIVKKEEKEDEGHHACARKDRS